MTNPVPDAVERSLDELYGRPGFLLRRAHQISVALFLEETAGLGLTTTQYGMMVVLRAKGSLDQASLARSIGIDRSTSGLVVGKLQQAGYIQCRIASADKRRKMVSLSETGHAMLDNAAEPARRSSERALQALPAKDAAKLLRLLHRFVQPFNATTRAPMRTI